MNILITTNNNLFIYEFNFEINELKKDFKGILNQLKIIMII